LTQLKYADIEHVTLTGAAALNATGNAADNILIGNDGANILDGGLGADSMTGGKGNDTYKVDDIGDTVTEGVGGGTDTVVSSVSFVLGANVENLTLIGADDIDATGNDLANILIGNDGSNILTGGKGDDTYYVGAGDTVVELADEGNDTIVSSADFALDVGSSIENLTLSGSDNIDGTGSSVANKIVGNSGDNILDGMGGVDSLFGGKGNDTYRVDLTVSNGIAKLEDSVTEGVNAGTDTIVLRGIVALGSASTLTLGANIENLDASLTGTTKLNLMGNALDNSLTGNDADNILDGGAGKDALEGGDGNDTYIVDITQSGGLIGFLDSVDESGTGNDTIKLRGSVSLSDWNEVTLSGNVENLDVSATGSTKLNLTGNAADNVLTGNAGANTLDGGMGADTLDGGLGADRLIGGGGNDTFVFSSAADLFNSIADFSSGDKIAFKASAFSALGGAGALDPNMFARTDEIMNGTEHLFYNPFTHNLYYDADGLGGISPFSLIATLENGATLTAADFVLV
jgi:Ca2+-binding RTX toxin-like protein